MKHLHYEKRGAVGTLKINRPEALNALNRVVLEELWQFFSLAIPYENLKVLIFTGSGKAFIAGADIKEMQAMQPEEMQAFSQLGQKVASLIENCSLITLAAVNGYALGGGLEMALACDCIFCTEEAKLGLPEVTLGLIPGFGGTQRLARTIGFRQAKELIYTGRIISASEALSLGIVNRVYKKESLMEECQTFAETILKNSFFALQQAKVAINYGRNMPLEGGLELEKNLCALCFTTAERDEKMKQFTQK